MLSLEEIARNESNLTGFNGLLTKYRHWAMAPEIKKLRQRRLVYDIGAGEGANTLFLSKWFNEIISIEPTSTYSKILKRSHIAIKTKTKATIAQSTLEKMSRRGLANAAICTCVLEHVNAPIEFLMEIYKLLHPGGILLLTVPNAESLHRRIGQRMGLIRSLTDLQEHDRRFGHRRYYTADTLKKDIREAGFSVCTRGIMLKPLPNAQMANLPSSMLDAFYHEGAILDDLCAEILSIAKKD